MLSVGNANQTVISIVEHPVWLLYMSDLILYNFNQTVLKPVCAVSPVGLVTKILK